MPSRPALCDDPATIDADWMQRALAAGGASDYPAIRDVVVEDLGAASNAFGRLLRCHLTADGGVAADPATVIVKLPPADRRAFRFARWMWMHERECLYYRRLARHARIRSPTLLYGDFDEATHRFVLVLEDLRDLEVPVQVAGVFGRASEARGTGDRQAARAVLGRGRLPGPIRLQGRLRPEDPAFPANRLSAAHSAEVDQRFR